MLRWGLTGRSSRCLAMSSVGDTLYISAGGRYDWTLCPLFMVVVVDDALICVCTGRMIREGFTTLKFVWRCVWTGFAQGNIHRVYGTTARNRYISAWEVWTATTFNINKRQQKRKSWENPRMYVDSASRVAFSSPVVIDNRPRLRKVIRNVND